MSRKDQLLRILAALDGHFAADDCSPADADRWRELKRHITRMRDGLALVETMLCEQRERGIPLTDDAARTLEGYARFGLETPPRKRLSPWPDGAWLMTRVDEGPKPKALGSAT